MLIRLIEARRPRCDQPVRFDRRELDQILRLHGRIVAMNDATMPSTILPVALADARAARVKRQIWLFQGHQTPWHGQAASPRSLPVASTLSRPSRTAPRESGNDERAVPHTIVPVATQA